MDEFATGGQPTAANAPVSLLLTMLPLRIADEERPHKGIEHVVAPHLQRAMASTRPSPLVGTPIAVGMPGCLPTAEPGLCPGS